MKNFPFQSNSTEISNDINDPQKQIELEIIEQEKKDLSCLRSKYNKHVFNKKMTEYYLDLNQSQKDCDESIKYLSNKIEEIHSNNSHCPLFKHRIASKQITNSKLIKSNSYSSSSFFNSTMNNNKTNTKSIFKIQKNNSVVTTKMTLDQTIRKTKLQKSFSSGNFFSKQKNKPVKNDDITISRRKKYKVSYIINWSKSQGFIEKKEASKKTYTSQFYQKQLITSELLVIYHNLSTFRMSYVDDLISIAPNINEKYIRTINIIIEETSGLMLEIVHLFLWDFIKFYALVGKDTPVFPSIPLDNAEVFDEVAELKINLKDLNDVTDFLKQNNEIYELLIAQLGNLALSLDNILKIKQYLSRCRYNISKLIFTSKSYIDKFDYDENAYGNYRLKILKIDNKTKSDFNRNDDIETKRSEMRESNERKRMGLLKKYNAEAEKIRKLTALLNSESMIKDKEFENKIRECAKNKEKHIDLESKMMNKLLKYMSIEKQNQIIGEKLIQSFKLNKVKSNFGKFK